MRVIVRKERPHPGAQLRFTDIDGRRFTAFATSTRHGQLADLEPRHRRRACCEDRIRNAKDTGLRNLPLHGYDQNQIWCQIVALACELLAWMAMLALTGTACRWENPSACGYGCCQPPGGSSAAVARRRDVARRLFDVEHEADRPLPQLIRILPWCWHDSILWSVRSLHETLGDSRQASGA